VNQTSNEKFINDFTSGPVLPALVAFSFPLFLSNLLQAIYNVVDMVVVGRVVGETGLSGLAVGGDVLNLLTFLSIGFSNAGQIIISQYIGAGLREKLGRFIGTMASFLMLCAVGMSVLCLLLRGQILWLMRTPAESWGQALAYSTTCMFGLVFIYGYNIVSAVLRGMGDSKRPFLFIAIAAILNLLLDLLFVAGLRWEAFGAALATVIAQGTSFLCSLVYLYRHRGSFSFDFAPASFRIHPNELLTLVKLGVPMAIRSASILFSKLFVNAWINGYGVTISAVTGAGYKVNLFGDLIGNATTAAGGSMVAQNIGAGKYDRASRTLGAAFVINGVCYTVLIALVFFFPRAVFGLFTKDAHVLQVCMEFLPAALLNFLCSALRGSMNTFTNGCGNYKFNFWVAILDGIVARIGFALLLGLALGWGYYGFWMGNAIAGGTPFLLGGVYYLSGRWKRRSSLLDPE
jgi:putative MATE family efflux protein